MPVKYENGRLLISAKDRGHGEPVVVSFLVDSETNCVCLMDGGEEYPEADLDIKEISQVIAALEDMRVALKQDGGCSIKDYK